MHTMTRPVNTEAPQAPVVDLEERHWLAAHLRGDQQAFAKLMQAYRKPVYSLLMRQGLEPQYCDDLFQEIFIKIHRSAHQYQARRPLSPWIFTIAINTLRNHFRSQPQSTASAQALEAVCDEQPGPEQVAELDETLDWLEQAVVQLPRAQAEALTLSVVKGMKLQDICQVLNIPLNTLKTHLRRARQNLLNARRHSHTHRSQP